MYIRVVTDAYLSLSLRPVVSHYLTRETREFHCWNSRIPLLELVNSTAGTREFHRWNS